MEEYAALLRGIMPSNPAMRNSRLCALFEELGFRSVRAVIASGNILFESAPARAAALEERIEKALPAKLGFSGTVIVRSRAQLEALAASDPFKGRRETGKVRLNVTFLKDGGEVFSAVDLASERTPDVMRRLEQEHGKRITMRTWRTVRRILKAFGDK